MLAFLVFLLCSAIAVQSEEAPKQVELLPELVNGLENLADKITGSLYFALPASSNVVTSPISLYTAFASLLYGADGATKDELAKFIGFPNSNDETYAAAHKNLGEFLKSLEIKKTGPCFSSSNKNVSQCTFEDVSIANGLFLDKQNPIVPSYGQGLKSLYDGVVENVDFAHEPVEATNQINKWIADKTHDEIPDLLKQPVDSTVRIVLAAALYFSAKWPAGTFEGTRTEPEKFTTAENTEVKVEYMKNTKEVLYYKGTAFQAVSLPYREGDFEALIVLPDSSYTLEQFITKFSKIAVKKIRDDSTNKTVNYKIPHIDTECSSDLVAPLKRMNLTGIFAGANLSKLVSGGLLQVSKVTHSAKLQVDEKGTVATGATAFEVSLRSGRQEPKPIEFFVTRPFLFIIYHKYSSMPLFTSIIRNPAV